MPEPKHHLNRRHTDGIEEPLWTLEKGPRRLACELLDHGAHGAEYRLLGDDEVYASRCFERLDLALVGAKDIRRQFEHDGWTGIRRTVPMADELYYCPTRKLPSPQVPQSGERLFEFLRGLDRIVCELCDDGPDGVNVQFFQNDKFSRSRRFGTRALAIQWAEEERKTIERETLPRHTE
jgi:hypothetical protein